VGAIVVGRDVDGDDVGDTVGCLVGFVLGEEGACFATVTVEVVSQIKPVAFNLLTLDNKVSLAKVPFISAATVSFLRIVTKLPLLRASFVAF
jgi:hypothetical protein